MSLWLMHTYAAYLCGRFPEDLQNSTLEERAFLLGNIAPDWINFVPDGRKKYRAQSHYKGETYDDIRLDQFKRDYLDTATSSVEKAFYEGYAIHLLLDFRWGKNIYEKYRPVFSEKKEYYEESVRWDGVITRFWPHGKECRQFLQKAPQIFDGIKVNSSFIPPEALEQVKEQAGVFANTPIPEEPPYIFAEADVMDVINTFLEDYQIFFK